MTDEIGISVLALILAYLLGSIPSAYLAGRLRKGIDIRQVGTRTMGAMTVFYQVVFASGVLVLIADMGKGVAALALARWLGAPEITVLLAGAAAIAGHSFPLWLNFRGGKGGASARPPASTTSAEPQPASNAAMAALFANAKQLRK